MLLKPILFVFFCGEKKQYSAMLYEGQVVPSVLNADITECYLSFDLRPPGEYNVGLTSVVSESTKALVCKGCREEINKLLSDLRKEKLKKNGFTTTLSDQTKDFINEVDKAQKATKGHSIKFP